jgi:hypothetical protein
MAIGASTTLTAVSGRNILETCFLSRGPSSKTSLFWMTETDNLIDFGQVKQRVVGTRDICKVMIALDEQGVMNIQRMPKLETRSRLSVVLNDINLRLLLPWVCGSLTDQ